MIKWIFAYYFYDEVSQSLLLRPTTFATALTDAVSNCLLFTLLTIILKGIDVMNSSGFTKAF